MNLTKINFEFKMFDFVGLVWGISLWPRNFHNIITVIVTLIRIMYIWKKVFRFVSQLFEGRSLRLKSSATLFGARWDWNWITTLRQTFLWERCWWLPHVWCALSWIQTTLSYLDCINPQKLLPVCWQISAYINFPPDALTMRYTCSRTWI